MSRPPGALGNMAAAPITQRILGLDPGLQVTGFGIVDACGPRLAYVASGTIRTIGTGRASLASATRGGHAAKGDLPARLKLIFDGVREVVQTYRPQCASVEIVFVNVNPQSTLLLGQARGAALAALLDGDIEVAEYTALQMKKAMVGHGHARKEQVQAMVARLLNLATAPGTDASDALGMAITHAHAGASLAALRAATPLARKQHAQYRKGRVY